MAVSFAQTIKPYFTDCFQEHMLTQPPPNLRMDLWNAGQVQKFYNLIYNAVQGGDMPAGGCPGAPWNSTTQQQFLTDFAAWKAGGFQP